MCFSFLVAILCLDKSTRQCSPERKTSALSVLNQPDRKSDLFCGTHSTEASVSLSECFPFWNFRSTSESSTFTSLSSTSPSHIVVLPPSLRQDYSILLYI
ncbi:hypothetical protein RvY_08602-2 [Ramazzottius varieornatus]|uniref:Secreted protein n=1 Tax=Ramazzottius varieornatus TaxID=947166 RepID=A0A1D1VFM6_RAMVA|nr:hypothetical protein RvY_08602-2 [Ramazzottius varieornatus]